MPTNYDASTVGVPYVRVPTIQIRYPKPLHGYVTFQEVEAVLLADGTIRQIGDLGEKSFEIKPEDMADVLQLVDPNTGSNIPGATMTVQNLMLGILAIIRREQIAQAG